MALSKEEFEVWLPQWEREIAEAEEKNMKIEAAEKIEFISKSWSCICCGSPVLPRPDGDCIDCRSSRATRIACGQNFEPAEVRLRNYASLWEAARKAS